MITRLMLQHVGPVQPLEANFGPRLNVLTGDNGLGKSFLLDVCFWALTGAWPGGRTALPEPGQQNTRPEIIYDIAAKRGPREAAKTATFDFHSQSWLRPKGRPARPGLIVYAAVDGGFAVWDPARHYQRDPATGAAKPSGQPAAYQFAAQDVADGLSGNGAKLCNGLIQDWVEWYYRAGRATGPFDHLQDVIAALSHPSEPLRCKDVEPQKVFVDDSRKFPVLQMPYGQVAYPHWSAGVKRIVSLAYLIVWAWEEHRQAAALRKEEPADQLVLIVDEIEAHLHPRWQRSILPALLTIVGKLAADVRVQVITATHSPLVLASLEPHFDAEKDRFFLFDLGDGKVSFESVPWATRGDIVAWLTSDIFGLEQARSREAEQAIESAEAFLRGDVADLPPGLKTKEKITEALQELLPGLDPFWPRWIVEAKP